MRKYLINFRKSFSERKAEISAKAYSHYRNLQPIVGKVYNPFKQIHNKYLGKFYGQSKKR